MNPTLIEKFADNGQHSHWSLVDSETGKVLWEEGSTLPSEVQKFHRVFDDYVHDSYLSPEGGDIFKVEKAFHKVMASGAYVSPYDLPEPTEPELTDGDIMSANLRLPLCQKPPILHVKE